LIPVAKLEMDGKKLSSNQLLVACNPILSHIPFRRIEAPMTQQLIQFETSIVRLASGNIAAASSYSSFLFSSKQMNNQMKFGVLLAHEGQTQESQMFANGNDLSYELDSRSTKRNSFTDSHPLFDEFLALIGEKVKLEGFSNYAGGLDTKSTISSSQFSISLTN